VFDAGEVQQNAAADFVGILPRITIPRLWPGIIAI
jgi:hypothetical protein